MDDSKDYWEPAAAARRDREREEYIKRYTAATGQICGVVSPPPIGDHQRVEIAFQPTIGHWVDGSGGVEVGRDGRFCSNRLGPGEYYLHYTRGPWTEYLESALYYPGVVDREKAAIVSVSAGQVRSNLVFKVPKQESYTVRGFISVDDKSGLGDDGAQALLIGLDGKIWRSQKIDFRSSFPLPKVKYFTFDDVLPGRYIASVWAPGQDWVTRIVDVNVSTHAKLIWLELKHRKAKR